MLGRSALRPNGGRPSAASANGRRPRPPVGAAGWRGRTGTAAGWGALSGSGAVRGRSMSGGRRQVFIGKVLKRLFAATPSTSHVPFPSGEEMVPKNLASKPEPKDFENAQASSECASSPGRENEILLPRRLYTVSLPPEGYVPDIQRTGSPTNAENSESSDEVADEGSQGQPKRRRIRRKKQRNIVGNPENVCGGQTESGKHETLFQDNLQLQQTEDTKISKNKKRKMKKKRQKEKMRAAGLLTKTTAVDFTYQPEKDNSEEADIKDIYEKADGILDFLRATQEIYFADNKSTCTDSTMSSATFQDILQHLQSHSMASSDVALLHQMKSLVLLQDIERLKSVLEQFQEYSMMLPDHAKILSSLFHYWITDILPVKNRK